MSQVYEFSQDNDRYWSLLPSNDDSLEILGALGHGKRPRRWRSVSLKVVPSSRRLARGDFVSFSSAPQIVTERCRKLLAPLVADCVEFLPIIAESTQFYILRVTKILDCIDRRLTKWQGLKEWAFKSPHFHRKRLGTVPIFAIPENSCMVFVQQVFVDFCGANDLRGLKFKSVWNPQK